MYEFRDVRAISKLYLYALLAGMASGIWSFIPIFLLDLKGNVILVGLLSSLPQLASTIMQLSWGKICDETGESKRLMLAGFILTIVFGIPTIFSTEPWQIILFMSLQALFASIGGVAGSIYLASLINSRIRARFMSTYNPMSWIGYMVGAVLAGFVIAGYGYIPAFSVYIALNISIIFFLKFMEEPKVDGKRMKIGAIFKRGFLGVFNPYREMPGLIREGRYFARWTLGIALRGLGLSAAGPILTVYMVNYLGATKPQIGELNAVMALVRIIMMPFLGWIADIKGRKLVFVSGVGLAIFYPIVYASSANIEQLYLAFMLSGLFWACINASWFAWEMDLIPRRRGEFLGLSGLINGAAWTIGPLIGGFLGEANFWLNILVSAIFTSSGFIVLLLTPEKHDKK